MLFVQNLACLDCLHWFVAVATVFPVTTPSNCNKCAEWFTDCVTDDTTNPTRKFPNPLGIGSSNDMRAPNNRLGQRTVDSASEVTWKIGPSLGGDSQTCKNREQCFCQKMGEGCHFAVAVDSLWCWQSIRKIPHCKRSSCAQTAQENKGISTCFGIHHALFHMFCHGPFPTFVQQSVRLRNLLFWSLNTVLDEVSLSPGCGSGFVSKRACSLKYWLRISAGHLLQKQLTEFFMMKLNDRRGTNNSIVFDKAQSGVLVCWCWLRHCCDYFCLVWTAPKWGLMGWSSPLMFVIN